MKKIVFTVTNDLTYDQRMQRICTSLSHAGYAVLLTGRRLHNSQPLTERPFRQKRLHCFFSRGKLFYAEYNLRLFLFLLFVSTDCYCAIDLDTILPNYFASVIRRKKRVYDAHELFAEQKEIITRPGIYKLWMGVEKFAVPRFRHGYTVNDFIANELHHRYGVRYSIVRNLPVFDPIEHTESVQSKFIIYQGAVNEGRSFETLIPAMKLVDAQLLICGDGNYFEQVKQLIADNGLREKIVLKGMVPPAALKQLTPQATAAVMLFENTGLNQYQSLANRFFDYIMAGVPQVCVAYPQYKAINERYAIAHLIEDTQPATIAAGLNKLLNDAVYHTQLCNNCREARKVLNWESEEQTLIQFYQQLFLTTFSKNK